MSCALPNGARARGVSRTAKNTPQPGAPELPYEREGGVALAAMLAAHQRLAAALLRESADRPVVVVETSKGTFSFDPNEAP